MIRTHETVSRLPVFKTGAFDHSATPPTSPALSKLNRFWNGHSQKIKRLHTSHDSFFAVLMADKAQEKPRHTGEITECSVAFRAF